MFEPEKLKQLAEAMGKDVAVVEGSERVENGIYFWPDRGESFSATPFKPYESPSQAMEVLEWMYSHKDVAEIRLIKMGDIKYLHVLYAYGLIDKYADTLPAAITQAALELLGD